MVPIAYHTFFGAGASVAGTLIGLLFVAISVSPHKHVGTKAPLAFQVQAGVAFTTLINALVIALAALLPGRNLGTAAVILAAAGKLRRMSSRLAEIGPETVYGLLGDYFSDRELFSEIQGQVLEIGAGVMATILQHAAQRGETRDNIRPMVATIPTDLFRHQLFITRTPPSEHVLVEIVDDIFLPLVRQPVPARATASHETHADPPLNVE